MAKTKLTDEFLRTLVEVSREMDNGSWPEVKVFIKECYIKAGKKPPSDEELGKANKKSYSRDFASD